MWRFTGFYGNLNPSLRIHSWMLLHQMTQSKVGSNMPWLIGGDFNEVCPIGEKARWCPSIGCTEKGHHGRLAQPPTYGPGCEWPAIYMAKQDSGGIKPSDNVEKTTSPMGHEGVFSRIAPSEIWSSIDRTNDRFFSQSIMGPLIRMVFVGCASHSRIIGTSEGL